MPTMPTPSAPTTPGTPPYRDIPGYPTPPTPPAPPAPADPGAPPAPPAGDSRQFFSDEARARLWRLVDDPLTKPPLISGGALHLANLRASTELSAMPTCPSRLVNDTNRADLYGVAVTFDESSVQMVFQIAQHYPGAIAGEHDIAELSHYHTSYLGLGMYYNTLMANAADIQVTRLSYGKYLFSTCDRILAGVKEAAAAGAPAAKAALPQIEEHERKLKEKRRATASNLQQAKAEGQGELAQLTALYQQALASLDQQQKEVAALRHELTLARSASPPAPAAAPTTTPGGRAPARATPR